MTFHSSNAFPYLVIHLFQDEFSIFKKAFVLYPGKQGCWKGIEGHREATHQSNSLVKKSTSKIIWTYYQEENESNITSVCGLG